MYQLETRFARIKRKISEMAKNNHSTTVGFKGLTHSISYNVPGKNYDLYCYCVCCSSQHHTNAKNRLSNRAVPYLGRYCLGWYWLRRYSFCVRENRGYITSDLGSRSVVTSGGYRLIANRKALVSGTISCCPLLAYVLCVSSSGKPLDP